MPESEKRSFWDRLFNTNQRSVREERVLEYIMHRVGEGAHLGDVVNEEYVKRNATPEEVEEICAPSWCKRPANTSSKTSARGISTPPGVPSSRHVRPGRHPACIICTHEHLNWRL